MDYVVLARKLRPTRFSDLIGQETVATALRNAVTTNRVAHAFLFAGSRGVGKTSTARILTKVLNCLDPQQGEPCNQCENCQEITNNSAPDVFEIDAASNRGIDNIRELRENTKFTPVKCPYKTYIIDEVHMLTMESFNALLKTLEEPPPHVKFILATTNPHKIPETILSRCQRFDFSRIPTVIMADYLSKVSETEGLKLSRKALEAIARNASGGMRDALTALDQVISYCGAQASDEEVMGILGLMDTREVFELLGAMLDKSLPRALEVFSNIREHGHDLGVLLQAIMRELKDFALYQSLTGGENRGEHRGRGTQTTAITFQDHLPDTLAFFESYREIVSLDELQQLFYLFLEVEGQIKRSEYAQACFEMGLIKACRVQPLVGMGDLLSRVRGMLEAGGAVKTYGAEASAPSTVSPAPSTVSPAPGTAPPAPSAMPPVPSSQAPEQYQAQSPEYSPPQGVTQPPQGAGAQQRQREGGTDGAGGDQAQSAEDAGEPGGENAGKSGPAAQGTQGAHAAGEPPALSPPAPDTEDQTEGKTEDRAAQAAPETRAPQAPPNVQPDRLADRQADTSADMPSDLPPDLPPAPLPDGPPPGMELASNNLSSSASPAPQNPPPQYQPPQQPTQAPQNAGEGPTPPGGSGGSTQNTSPQNSGPLPDEEEAPSPFTPEQLATVDTPAPCDDERWRSFVEAVRESNSRTAANLRRMEVEAISDEGITLVLPDATSMIEPRKLEALRPLLDKAFSIQPPSADQPDASPAFHIRFNDDKNKKARFEYTISGRHQLKEEAMRMNRREAARQDPGVEDLRKYFPNSRVVKVELDDSESKDSQ